MSDGATFCSRSLVWGGVRRGLRCYRDPTTVAEIFVRYSRTGWIARTTAHSIHAMGKLRCRVHPHLPRPAWLRSPLPQAPDRIACFHIRSGEPPSLPSSAPYHLSHPPSSALCRRHPRTNIVQRRERHGQAAAHQGGGDPCLCSPLSHGRACLPRPFPSRRPSAPLVVSLAAAARIA
jgi:hypothetical protein